MDESTVEGGWFDGSGGITDQHAGSLKTGVWKQWQCGCQWHRRGRVQGTFGTVLVNGQCQVAGGEVYSSASSSGGHYQVAGWGSGAQYTDAVDRLIQQALHQVLSEIFEPEFSKSSFGFRPGRNAHQAVKQT